jgi:hypothetical protein
VATRTISEAGGNWSALGTWVEGAVPTAADDVAATSKSGNLTIDVEAKCKNANFTNYVGKLTHNAFSWLISGSLTLVPAMTYAPASTRQIGFVGVAGNYTIVCAGKSLGKVYFQQTGAEGKAIWQLEDTFKVLGLTQIFTGTLDCTKIKEMSTGSFVVSNASGIAKLGLVVITLTQTTSGEIFNAETGTLEGLEATVIVGTASASERIINLGNRSLGVLSYVIAGSTGKLTITHTGAIIGTLNFSDASNERELVLTKSQTLTVTNFNVNGTSGKLVTVASSTAGTKATISKVSGYVQSDYLKLKDSKTTGDATWFAGKHSESVSGNEGWLFGERMFATAALAGSSKLEARGVRRRRETSELKASSELTGSAIRRRHATASCSAAAVLSASFIRRRTDGAALEAGASLSLVAIRRRSGTALLEATTYLSSSGVTRKFGRAQLSAESNLTARAICIRYNSAELTATSSLKAEGRLVVGASYEGAGESDYLGSSDSTYDAVKGADYATE